MNEWAEKLNAFLSLNDRDILDHAGQISHEMALEFAETEYEEFNRQRILMKDQEPSDFDKTIKRVEARKKKK